MVCKKLSCPQGSSRRGALIGAGADGCSAVERRRSAASRVTRERVITMGYNGIQQAATKVNTAVYAKRQRKLHLDVCMHARVCTVPGVLLGS